MCYAREDKNMVDKVYIKFKEAGFDPWMDKPPKPYLLDGIKPGEEWDAKIRKVIEQADYFLPFFSKNSVSKRGYVQREYRLALDLMNEIPPEDIFLIPVLLEECELPRIKVGAASFDLYHYFPLYETGMDTLVSFINDDFEFIHNPTSEPKSHEESASDQTNLNEPIVRAIEFPAEYYQAGLSILSYFSTLLRRKYPDINVRVTIEQDGLRIKMVIETPDGDREIIEKLLNEYGLVIVGSKSPSDITKDKLTILELKHQLKIAQTMIETQKEMINHFNNKT
jgi:hypothetical protein